MIRKTTSLTALILFSALLISCAKNKVYQPFAPASEEQSIQYDEEQWKDIANRFDKEATLIKPYKNTIQRNGMTLRLHSQNGKETKFTSNMPCVGFECKIYEFQGTYANNQFFKIQGFEFEFYTPTYLVSIKTGQKTSLIDAVTDKNMSPNHKYIANAVGGDAGPDAAIYIWQIKNGELEEVYRYAPEGKYANYRIGGWKSEDVLLIKDENSYEDSCKSTNNPHGWSKGKLELKRHSGQWMLKRTETTCINQS